MYIKGWNVDGKIENPKPLDLSSRITNIVFFENFPYAYCRYTYVHTLYFYGQLQ